MKLNDGDVKFTKAPLAHKVTNIGDTPFVNLTIEVKKASTKSVCGASWAGVEAEKGSVSIGAQGIRCEQANVTHRGGQCNCIHTYDVSQRWTSVGVGPKPKPSLLVALQEVEVTTGAKKVKLQPGEVTWIPANAKAQVAAAVSAGRSHWVVMSFE